MWTLVAFNENNSAASVWVNIKGAADQTTRVVADVVYVPETFNRLVAVCAIGYDITRAKLESPSIREMGVLNIEPKANYDYDSFRHYPVVRDSRQNPITLAPGEGLEGFVYCGRDSGEFQTIGVFLADSPITPVTGEIWTVRATYSSITPIESKWVNSGELVFDETLPVGNYQVVGATMWHQGGLLFRLVPVATPNRPGGICTLGEGAIEPPIQRMGQMGVWCTFHSSTPPSFDLLASDTTASSGSINLDLIRV